jgi:hypothetical protein
MEMKTTAKLVLVACLAIGLAIAFAGCSSAPIVYDKSVPTEQRSTMVINNYTWVFEFNGKKTNWVTSMFSKKSVIIPAGEHALLIGTDNNSREGKVKVTGNFLPGHTYLVGAYIMDSSIYGRIIDETALNFELLPNPTSPSASQFEGKWVDIKNAENQLIFWNNQYILQVNRKDSLRGFFSYDEGTKKIILFRDAYYSKGKWIASIGIAPITCDYNDTAIKDQTTEYRKVAVQTLEAETAR